MTGAMANTIGMMKQSVTVIISQLPTEQQYQAIGDNTLVSVILDRLLRHKAYRAKLKRETMQK
jgi:hypothetical protein